MFGFRKKAALLDERIYDILAQSSCNAFKIQQFLVLHHDSVHGLGSIYNSLIRLQKKGLIQPIESDDPTMVHHLYEIVPLP